MEPNEKKLWFGTKKYGYGWVPICWQGWVVVAAEIVLVGLGLFLLPNHLGLYVAYTLVLAIIGVVICFLKGEKPRWQKD